MAYIRDMNNNRDESKLIQMLELMELATIQQSCSRLEDAAAEITEDQMETLEQEFVLNPCPAETTFQHLARKHRLTVESIKVIVKFFSTSLFY